MVFLLETKLNNNAIDLYNRRYKGHQPTIMMLKKY